jgi:hypothetical protein
LPGEENEIMATALEAAAHSQEQGAFRHIGETYDPTYGRILELNSNYDDSIGFAFTFWDNWVDASNHEWQYHEPITRHDWPRLAREVAEAVRMGELPQNEFLVEQIQLKPRRSIWLWLKSIFATAN